MACQTAASISQAGIAPRAAVETKSSTEMRSGLATELPSLARRNAAAAPAAAAPGTRKTIIIVAVVVAAAILGALLLSGEGGGGY